MVVHHLLVAAFGGARLRVVRREMVHFLCCLVDEGEQDLEGDVGVFEYVCREGVHVVSEVVGKDSRYMESLSVVLRRLIDARRERLRQGEDSTEVVYLLALHKDRNLGEVVYQFGFAEGLEEVHDPCVREGISKDGNRHCAGCVEV